VTPDLNVTGPLARSAQDLHLELEVIGGPLPEESAAYRWHLPPPRGARLRDYRIGYVLDDPFCPVTPEVKNVLVSTIEALRKQGVEMIEGWPEGVSPQATFDNYFFLLAAFFSVVARPEEIEALRESLDSPWGYYARGWLAGLQSLHRDWRTHTEARLQARAVWQEYFRGHDAFIMPECFCTAIPHDQKLTFFERRISTSQGPRLYGDVLRWISFATLTGCPAVAAPAGRTRAGLPVGIQIMGPYAEDGTPIDIAGRMADVVGGFAPPPGYSL
jgi:amidase